MFSYADYFSLWRAALEITVPAVFTGKLRHLGLRKEVGKLLQPINTPTRFSEYLALKSLVDEALSSFASNTPTYLLDASSPKLFSLWLAKSVPATKIYLLDTFSPAVEEARDLARAMPPPTRAKLAFQLADLRSLDKLAEELDGSVNLAYSMSVIEHVEPELGGDEIALQNLTELVVPGGFVAFSVPVDKQRRTDFVRHTLYGRHATTERPAFFQRVYSVEELRRLTASVSQQTSIVRVLSVRWPTSAAWRHLVSGSFPENARALFGPIFPLLATACRVEEISLDDLISFDGPGDAVLLLQRRKPVNA